MLDIVDSNDAKSVGQVVARQMWDQYHPPPCTNDGVDEEDADKEEDFENHNASSTSTEDNSNEKYLSHSEDVITALVVRKVSSVISLGRSS